MNNSASQNAFSEDHQSKSRQSGVIDLKLGRIMDQKISRTLSPSALKRSEQKGVCSSTPFCKVYGCNKNLSDCKEYYKRHKVCEVHSKTSKVIVNGMEQRFCQQMQQVGILLGIAIKLKFQPNKQTQNIQDRFCNWGGYIFGFHLVHEFDDGKRSCRKRLAGHNERRRKPQVGQRHGRLLPSYNNNISVEDFPQFLLLLRNNLIPKLKSIMVETRRSSSSSKRTLSSPCSSPIPTGKRSKAAAASSTTGTPVEPIEAVVKESGGCESQEQEVRSSGPCKKEPDACEEVTGVDVPEKSPVVEAEGLIIAWKFKRVVHKLVLVTCGEHDSKTLLFVAT